MAADELGSERDRIELQDRFSQLRPEILETLRTLLNLLRSPGNLNNSVVQVSLITSDRHSRWRRPILTSPRLPRSSCAPRRIHLPIIHMLL